MEVGVSLTDLKWVGFSGSGTGWGIRFMGTGVVHPLLEQNEQRSVMMHGRAVTIQVLHKELTNFVMGIDELKIFFNVCTSRDTGFPIRSRRLVFLKITPYQL